jgi:hypothetical protein
MLSSLLVVFLYNYFPYNRGLCIAGIEKMALLSSAVQNNCTKIPSLFGNTVTMVGSGWEERDPAGPAECRPSVSSPPPHMVDYLICGQSYIY